MRTQATPEQRALLHESFAENAYPKDYNQLSSQLGLPTAFIRNWFARERHNPHIPNTSVQQKSAAQVSILQAAFESGNKNYPRLAEETGLSERQVSEWLWARNKAVRKLNGAVPRQVTKKTDAQIQILEDAFLAGNRDYTELAARSELRRDQVTMWFVSRRAKADRNGEIYAHKPSRNTSSHASISDDEFPVPLPRLIRIKREAPSPPPDPPPPRLRRHLLSTEEERDLMPILQLAPDHEEVIRIPPPRFRGKAVAITSSDN
ncbi:hypothetical protein DL96DRAFT_1561643 [Flagelloscypha sp. PMI_526]|nr:hypothetical protein DL96DRAFT_1561643 [Flagelloscypha sp. PMI_526]